MISLNLLLLISFETDTIKRGGPSELNPGSLAHQSIDHPCHKKACDAARATIQYVYRPYSDDVVDQFLHFLLWYFVGFTGVRFDF